MNELHTKILDAARDEVAKRLKIKYLSECKGCTEKAKQIAIEQQVALLAMEKQTTFYREISHQGYVCLFRSQLWTNPKKGETITELELYNIWREGK